MTEETVKIVRVFIGSPSGLDAERKAARRIVNEINQSHSEHWRCQINLIGWEETLPGHKRAQSLINQDLDKCSYFIGVIWDNWGSKPGDGDDRYSSGFEEEYERAKQHFEEGRMKDIALYFKDIQEIKLKDLHPSHNKVREFREKCISSHSLLFKEFKTLAEFESIFRATIEAIGWQEAKGAIGQTVANLSYRSSKQIKSEETAPAKESEAGLLDAGSASFVSELLQKPSDWEATDKYEVARFRLIAASLSRDGNDNVTVGNHDTNLLFHKREEWSFSSDELLCLIEAGISGYVHSNVPLWHWLHKYQSVGSGLFQRIGVLAAVGKTRIKTNAIRILHGAKQPVPSINEYYDNTKAIKHWIDDEAEKEVCEASLKFIVDFGNEKEVEVLEQQIENGLTKHRSEVVKAIIDRAVLSSTSKGFEKLFALSPDSVSQSTVKKLFQHPSSLATDDLLNCLDLKVDKIRRKAAELLYKRSALNDGTIDKLLTDSDRELRFIALKYLLDNGNEPEEGKVRSLLIESNSRGLSGLFSFNNADQTYFDLWKEHKLSRESYRNLKKIVDESIVFDHIPISAMYSKYRKESLNEIRQNLGDGFANFFQVRLRRVYPDPNENSENFRKAKGLEDFHRSILIAIGLKALCINRDSADLVLVRKVLNNYEVAYSEEVLDYLARFGDWNDRNHILKFSTRYDLGTSLLSLGFAERYPIIASTLLAVGKLQLDDLFELEMDHSIRCEMFKKLKPSVIDDLSDAFLLKWLNSEDDETRKILAMKCSFSLTKKRIKKLLRAYLDDQESRYYNVIHWLDCGASLPRAVAKSVTGFELREFGNYTNRLPF